MLGLVFDTPAADSKELEESAEVNDGSTSEDREDFKDVVLNWSLLVFLLAEETSPVTDATAAAEVRWRTGI